MRSTFYRSNRFSSVLLAATILAAPPVARAVPIAFTGAADLDFNNAANWSAGGPPGGAVGQTAVFGVAPAGTVTLGVSPANALRGITIGNGTGGTATMNASNVASVNLGGAAITLNGNLETESAAATNARTVFFARTGGGAGAFVIDNNLVLDIGGTASARFLLVGANKSLTLNGVVSSGTTTVASGTNKGLAKDGDGTLTLTNAANSYLGATEVIAGSLVLNGNAGTASGVLGVGTGAVTLGTNNTGAAQTVSLLSNGAFTVGRDVVVSNANVSTGTIAIGNAGSVATGTSTFGGNVALNRGVQLQSSGSAVADFTGVLSGVGGITKANNGTVRLSNAANAFAGPVVILNGTLAVNALGALGTNAAAITFGNATNTAVGTLSYAGNSTTLDRDLVVQTQSTGGGSIDVATAGQKLTIGSAIRTVTGNGRFVFGGAGDADVASLVANTGTAVIKSGLGVGRLLNANNTYTGQTIVRNGPLLIDAAGQLGASSGIVLIDATSTAAASPSFLTTTGFTVAQNVLVDDVAGSTGTSTIGAANTQAATSTTFAGTVTLNRAIRLASDTAAGQAVTFAGPIVNGTGAFGIAKVGGGTVVLSNANNTYSGPTRVSAGRLLVNGALAGGGTVTVDAGATLGGTGSITGNVAVTGTLAPGASSIESLDVTGDVSLVGTLAIDLDPTAGGTADLLAQAGTGRTFTIDPNAALSLSFAAMPDDAAYVFATYDTLAGAFAPANVVGLPAGYALDYHYLGANQIAVVAAAAVPEPTTLAALLAGGVAVITRRRRH